MPLGNIFTPDDLSGFIAGRFCTGPSGEINAIGDYSSVETRFTIEVDPTETFVIARIAVHLSLGMKVSEAGYAASMSKLNVGIQPDVTREENGQDIRIASLTSQPAVPTTDTNIKSNVDYGRFTTIDIMSKERSYDAVWQFDRNNKPIVLHGSSNEKLIFILNDDFSDAGLSLLEHTFYASGYLT